MDGGISATKRILCSRATKIFRITVEWLRKIEYDESDARSHSQSVKSKSGGRQQLSSNDVRLEINKVFNGLEPDLPAW